MKSTDALELDRPAVDVALVIVRIALAAVFFAHGSQKLLGLFGGGGLTGTIQAFGPIGYLVAVGEFFGSLGMLLGFLSRFSAAAQMIIMFGAIAQVHGANGFFITPDRIGFEYNLALIGLQACILVAGPGRYAIGRMLPLPKSGSSNRPVICLE